MYPDTTTPTRMPTPGELWETTDRATGSTRLAVLHAGSAWSVLTESNGELMLTHLQDLLPVRFVSTAGPGWANHFDALCAAAGLNLTWQDYITAIRDAELARFGAEPILI